MRLLRPDPKPPALGTPPIGGSAAAGRGADEFDAIFRSCVADVHSYAFALLRDRAAAEDVTATAFERLFRARGRLDARRGSARALLFTIARNAALDELRRRARRPLADTEAGERPDAHAEEEFAQVERRSVVAGALETLSPRERELVLLKFHGQLSNAELGRALGISESNAATRLHRALTRLRSACTTEREQAA